MAKRKNSPALFEVIARDRERQSQAGLKVPSWMGGRKEPESADEPSPPEAPTRDQAAQAESSAKPPAEQPEAPAKPAEPVGPARTKTDEASDEPVFSTSGGRLRVSLDYSGAIVACVAMVLLLGAAFAIGRATGGDATEAGIGATRPGEAGDPDSTAALADREPGKYYLIIMDVSEDSGWSSDVPHVARFYADHGEEVDTVRWPDPDTGETFVAVWSSKAFDRPDSRAAENYESRIRELGRQYRQQHGNVPIDTRYAMYRPQSQ